MLEIKTKAPLFELPDKDGNLVRLEDFFGQKVVLYFYPKDNTSGCTLQAQMFAKEYAEFEKLNVKVIGISKDSVKSHKNFCTKYELPFILLSDTSTEIIQAYDCFKEKKMYGKAYMGTMRTTYIIDENGYIEMAWEKATPATNASDVLAYLNK